jgi:hypothetical protein
MRFPYVPMSAGAIGSVDMPMLPIRLSNGPRHVDELALIDSGAAIGILPFDIGIQLGLNWHAPMPSVMLGGNLGRHVAKGLSLDVRIGVFPPVQIIFAWSQLPDARLILGEVNFFTEFDICFHRSQSYFEVKPKP